MLRIICCTSRVMEAETIQKNGVCPKTLKSRINVLMMSLLLMLSYVGTMQAQDIIIKMNGNEIEAIVLEVGTNDVKYKKFDHRNGPTYYIRKSEIFMIKYEDGDKDVFAVNEHEDAIEDRGIVIGEKGYYDYKTNAFTVTDESYQELYYPPKTLHYHRKSPGGAFCLSFFLIPGIGQFYNGQGGKGATMMILHFGSAAVAALSSDEDMAIIGAGVFFANWLWSSIDAPVSANAINRRNARKALSWELGGNSTLSLRPDFYIADNKMNIQKKEAVYGLSLKLNF